MMLLRWLLKWFVLCVDRGFAYILMLCLHLIVLSMIIFMQLLTWPIFLIHNAWIYIRIFAGMYCPFCGQSKCNCLRNYHHYAKSFWAWDAFQDHLIKFKK